jgi:hypothetical protein
MFGGGQMTPRNLEWHLARPFECNFNCLSGNHTNTFMIATEFVGKIRADEYSVICGGCCNGDVLEWKRKDLSLLNP